MFENAVKQKNILSGNGFPLEKADLHIAFGISANFTYPVGVLLTSILENSHDIKIAFHIFIDDCIEDTEKEKFELLLERYNTAISIYSIDNKIFKGLNDAEFTIAAYYRFLIPYQLENIAEKYLYLDADMICVNSLSSFLNINFENNIACVVEDFQLNNGIPQLSDDKNNLYFNSGMMYIDINKWQQNTISEKSIALLQQVNKDSNLKEKYGYEFRCFDQDALNIILQKDVKYIEPRYNFLCNISLNKNKKMSMIPDDVYLLHYHGYNKPWHEWCFHPLAKYFHKYWQISPWQHTILEKNQLNIGKCDCMPNFFLKRKDI